MAYLGQIESASGTEGIDDDIWLAMIGSHGSLKHVPPVVGKNPKTGEPMELRAPTSTAVISLNSKDVGSVFWAMDGSPVLIVCSKEGMEEEVVKVATELAAILGGRFIPEVFDR